MTLSVTTAIAQSMATTIATAINVGTPASKIAVYTGAKPASPDVAASGTLLGEVSLTDPVQESVTAGVITLDFEPDLTMTTVGAGVASWFRIKDGNGAGVIDGTVGTSVADMIVSTVSWTVGSTVILTSGVITVPVG
jgi:hypothetical protein